ncbi:UDP-N-acetylmuramoyl-tripeptide--D-alanyl-D-alanine ligase [Peptoniphilus sp. MSJ-1]|uniref:UDP-N-acetylmuramoyl-tripeptide--D-alanyl-D-alanine ligase n=1 Tax=Peptoniphilus ovalis TaxID=2841503 RepID=A0ABS6FFQ9_9FIRM|nr:UDP-N-acetylmuramoyl-tripeptide--D-alanyl-D-alanine ligase [Peptoniphilus ovalis]MBU5668372.1 UDP-N-acetylmuramoyl-tripeptide--D-alanyl-D-alanine ligase [Peptoniphilus ovalis]
MEYILSGLPMDAINFVIIIVALFYSYIRSNFPIHMLQLEGYDNNEYKTFLKNNKDKMNKLVYKMEKNPKTPLVWTDRAKRLLKKHKQVNFVIFVIIVIMSSIIHLRTGSLLFGGLASLILSFLVYFYQYRILILSNKLAKPKEDRINMGFYKQAQAKIKKFKEEENLKVLGITGSFGKTSVKFISDTILSEGLRVKNTPSSFNTPMGLSKIINNELERDREVFIAELGAKVPGEIHEVAELVQPDIGIITAIGPTHMHLFKTIENIQKTKYELIEDLPEDGIAIFNYDNDYVKPLADKTKKKTYRYGIKDIEKLDVYADKIEVTENGSNFMLHIKKVGSIMCETKLLGVHNISNLLAAATAAYVLGLSLEKIASGIKKVEPVEHRLSLIPSSNGTIVIDDAFNSNPVGFRAALDVLREFKEHRKIIITPGMVELGDMEITENEKIGEVMADVVDFAILVGKKRTMPIYEGMTKKGFDKNKIYQVSSLNEATTVLAQISHAGDVVLFENDLPDNYNEE